MSKTIEQLAVLAAQIEEATRQGENTALRVGGLFTDIVDYIKTLHLNDVALGPLLTALNNSNLLDPSDGQTLTFSVMDDKWTFSSALTQLKIAIGQITTTVTDNYNSFLSVKKQLEDQITATDARARAYKSEYDQSQISYATWKSQTDTSISQFAVAIDENTGNIVSMSKRIDTAYDQIDSVSNNMDAADKALEKLFNLTGLNYEDPAEAYTASWLYKNRQGIYGAAATFDEDGNILSSSTLGITVNGMESKVLSAEGKVSLISQTVDEISSRVTNAEGNISQVSQTVSGLTSTVAGHTSQIDTLSTAINGSGGILSRLGSAEGRITDYADSASWVQQNKDSITTTVGYFNSRGELISTAGLVTTGDYAGLFAQYMDSNKVVTEGSMSVELEKYVKESEVDEEIEEYLSVAKIRADRIDFTFTKTTNFISGDTNVMTLDANGNLYISGKFHGEIDGSTVVRTSNYLLLDGENTRIQLNASTGTAHIAGFLGDSLEFYLGFLGNAAELYMGDTYMIDGSVVAATGSYEAGLKTIRRSGGTECSLGLGANGAGLKLSYYNGSGELYSSGGLKLSGIPTSKPSTSGYIYNDSGTLKIS